MTPRRVRSAVLAIAKSGLRPVVTFLADGSVRVEGLPADPAGLDTADLRAAKIIEAMLAEGNPSRRPQSLHPEGAHLLRASRRTKGLAAPQDEGDKSDGSSVH